MDTGDVDASPSSLLPSISMGRAPLLPAVLLSFASALRQRLALLCKPSSPTLGRLGRTKGTELEHLYNLSMYASWRMFIAA